MTYVDWFNHRRLHGEITNDASYTTPAEFEATYYRQTSRPSSRHPITRAVIKPGAVQTGDVYAADWHYPRRYRTPVGVCCTPFLEQPALNRAAADIGEGAHADQ